MEPIKSIRMVFIQKMVCFFLQDEKKNCQCENLFFVLVSYSLIGARHYFGSSNTGPYFYIFGGEGYANRTYERGMLNDIWLINTNASRPSLSTTTTTTTTTDSDTVMGTSSTSSSSVVVIIASVVSIIGAIAIIAAIIVIIIWR